MRVPKVHGIIRRRILVNFRVDAEVMQRHLPKPFRPKLHNGKAIAGICLIRLENIRPKRFPRFIGIASENAAHRVAVVWEQDGSLREGVYIPRRDTGSLLNQLAGGRIFPGEHHRALFQVNDDGERVHFEMLSADKSVRVQLSGCVATELPSTSGFASVAEASTFFEGGSLGYSATSSGSHLDGLVLKTATWKVTPLALEQVYSSFFADRTKFPEGSVAYDCALIMRNIEHEWHAAEELYSMGAA